MNGTMIWSGGQVRPMVPAPGRTAAYYGSQQFDVSFSAQDEEVAKHHAYLSRMVTEGVVAHEVSAKARRVWEMARKAVPQLSVPPAVAYDGGPIHYTWDNGRHVVTVEAHSDAPCDWYVSDRISGEFDGGEFDPATGLPDRLVDGLKRVME